MMVLMSPRNSALFESVAEILSNLDYVRQELPGLEIDGELRRNLLSGCAQLAGEVAELEARIRALEPGDADPTRTAQDAQEMIQRQVRALDELVMGLRGGPSSKGDYGALGVLFNESGASILRAYGSISENLRRLAS
jgi:hypothetical protein